MINMKKRLINFLIALDQLLYVIITLGRGNPDETISSAAWRLEHRGHPFGVFFRPVIDFLAAPFERNHCYKAYMSEHKSRCPGRLNCPLDKFDE